MKRIRLLGCCLALAAGAQLISLPVARAQVAAPPPSAPPLQLQPPMTAPPAGATGPIVTLRTNNPYARLQQMQLKWEEICVTPCGRPVDPNGTYRVAGGTIRPSDSFRMPRPSGPVLIDAQTGSTVKHWVGVGLAIGGGVSVLSGVLTLALASDTTDNGLTTTKNVRTGAGIAYLVIGAILLAIGIPLASSSTTVDVK